MTMYEVIEGKKRGKRLSAAEIGFFVKGFTAGEIPDYQAAAFLMAVYFRGMDKEEAYDLTMAMVRTGTADFGDGAFACDKNGESEEKPAGLACDKNGAEKGLAGRFVGDKNGTEKKLADNLAAGKNGGAGKIAGGVADSAGKGSAPDLAGAAEKGLAEGFDSGWIIADKHSTGGVSDATSLVIAPLVALSGLKFLKMSGRALGHTGGTIDKLESVPGFTSDLSAAAVRGILRKVGAVIVGQGGRSAPADKKLYALRDVTATVDSIPLIAASIMSKKLLSPAQILVLDVKYGGGAFLKTAEEARSLADYMREIARRAGRRARCVITSMAQPLGRFIGNALELYGAVEVLEGAQNDLGRLSFYLTKEILKAGRGFTDREAGDFIAAQIHSGAAREKLAEMIAAQGGDPSYVRGKEKLLAARRTLDVLCDRGGVIAAIDTEGLGFAANALGAGRTKKEDPIDPFVGIEVCKKLGEHVKRGDKLAKLYYNDKEADQAAARVRDCFTVAPTAPPPPDLIYGAAK